MTTDQERAMGKLDGEDLAEVVERSLNTYAFTDQIKQFVERMSCSHRTLQQTFTQLCAAWLTHLSKTEHYDGRNEASVKFARAIKAELDKAYFPFI